MKNMKYTKIILNAVGIFCFAIIGNTQRSVNNVFGVKGGLNLNSINTMYKDNPNTSNSSDVSIIGLHAGIYTDIPINDKIHFQPELLYTQSGQGLKKFYSVRTGEELGRDFRQIKNHIALPLMVKIYPVQAIKNLYAEAGPEIQYLINYKEKGVTIDGESFSATYNDDRFSKFSAGINIGIGLHTPIRGLTGNIRYHFGLLNTAGRNSDVIKEIPRSAQFGILYQLFPQ